MVTDNERREVARRLREYVDLPDDWWADTYSGFYVEKCAFGNVERHRESELFARLADLIEPSDHIGDSDKMVDREALLALADELEEDACWEVQAQGDTSGAWRAKDTCDRIREALGVES